MKNLKKVSVVVLLILAIHAFPKTAIIYVGADGTQHGVVLMNDIDSESLLANQGPDVQILDCWNFTIVHVDPVGEDANMIVALEKSSYLIKTDGNDITYVDKETQETILLMSAKDLGLTEDYFIDISSTISDNQEKINVLVSTDSPFTNIQERNSENKKYLKVFPISNINKGDGFSVYPNPATENLTISIPSNILSTCSNLQIVLFDITGRKIREISGISSNKLTIQRDDIQKGSYFYKLISNENVIEKGTFIFN